MMYLFAKMGFEYLSGAAQEHFYCQMMESYSSQR